MTEYRKKHFNPILKRLVEEFRHNVAMQAEQLMKEFLEDICAQDYPLWELHAEVDIAAAEEEKENQEKNDDSSVANAEVISYSTEIGEAQESKITHTLPIALHSN